MKNVFSAIILAGGSVFLGGAAAAQDKAAECRIQSEMVMAVVQSRGEGLAAEDAVQSVQSSLEGDQAKYASVVPAVVDWVYTLPEDQLGPEVGDSWTEACVAR